MRFLDKALEKCRGSGVVLALRIDAGLTHGEVLDHLTERKTRFVGRLKTNAVLDRLAQPYLQRPAGRPPRGGYETMVELGPHQAESCGKLQRLSGRGQAVRSTHRTTGPAAGLFFFVTSWKAEEKDVVAVLEHYRRRGTFEDRLGEFNATVHPRLSSPRFAENEALLLLSLLAFNLSSMLRNELEGRWADAGTWGGSNKRCCVLRVAWSAAGGVCGWMWRRPSHRCGRKCWPASRLGDFPGDGQRRAARLVAPGCRRRLMHIFA